MASSTGAPPPVTLVVGDEDLLIRRAVRRVVDAARRIDPETAVSELTAAALRPGDLVGRLAPTLFGGWRVLVLDGLTAATADLVGELTELHQQPWPQTAVVGLHPGGGTGKAVLEALRRAKVPEVGCARLRRAADRERFVVEEVTAAGGSITRDAVGELLATVGTDLAEIAGACAQLVSDSGGQVDRQVVARYHTGRADAGSFTIADRVVEGDTAGALELLRWALSVGQSPAGITAALAINLRTIGLVAGAGRSDPRAAAGPLGLPDWKVRRAQGWLRGWRPAGLRAAVDAVALADAEVKGAAAEPGYALTRAVLAVTAARER